MNDFDKTARRAVRDDPEGHVRWLAPRLAKSLRTGKPLESQSAPRPGEPDRRCDTILALQHEGGLGVPWALVVELFAASDADALDRLLEYIGRFRRELRHGPHGHDRYRWAAVPVFLTGGPEQAEIADELPGGDSGLGFRPRLVRLECEDAIATLTAIGDNRLAPSVLAWVPLMAGGRTAEAVAEWRAVAEACVPSEIRRRELAALALVFSELTDCVGTWEPGLEGFAVQVSKILQRERTEGQREALLEVLRVLHKDSLPPEVVERIKAETRPEALTRLLGLVGDLAAIRAAVGA